MWPSGDASLSVRAVIDGRTARATTNRLDDDVDPRRGGGGGRDHAADRSPIRTCCRWPNRPNYRAVDRVLRRHGRRLTPEERAEAVAEAIAVVEARGPDRRGHLLHRRSPSKRMLNSRGVFAYHVDTMAQFSITAMAGDSSGLGEGQRAATAASSIPWRWRAAPPRKPRVSRDPRELPPGRYTVILEPAAVLDLVGQMFFDFSATAIRDQRSFLNDRLGQQLFGENITIADDVYHPLQSGAPFDGEGVPRRRLTLVDDGVVREIACSRGRRPALAGREPTGHGFPLPNEFGEAPVEHRDRRRRRRRSSR